MPSPATPHAVPRGLAVAMWTAMSAVMCVVAYATQLGAQDTAARQVQLADRGPRFLTDPTDHSAPMDARDAAVLRRRVTLDFDRVTLADALGEITKLAGVRFAYSKELVAIHARVSLHADNLTVAGALFELLLDTGLDVHVNPTGLVLLVSRAATPLVLAARQAGGAVTGRVTDAVTHAPLDQVSIRVEGLGLGAVTTSDGRYSVRSVPSGAYRVTARRVGYMPLTRTVTVGTDSMVTIDFVLAGAPTKLNEVVTTAVGNQRRYEVGNVISTINADSLVRTAPITELTDILSARSPNVQVTQSSGIAGDGPKIRIRGLASFTLQNDPIIYVDGVRVDNSPGGLNDNFSGDGTHPTANRLNDLDPEEIASIEVLKGPSAATEYGTDAADGVIVVKTKRGLAGPPKWDAVVEQGLSTEPRHFEDNVYSWGHTLDANRTPVPCPLLARQQATCAVDSVTRFQPLDDASTTLFGTGYRGKYGMQVAGGAERLRYFLSGGLTAETGLLQMPPSEVARLAREGQSIPGDERRPNTLHQVSLRGSATRMSSLGDLTASAAYLSSSQTSPNVSRLVWGAYLSRGYRDSLGGYNASGGLFAPSRILASTGLSDERRFTGGLAGTWHPASWLAAHATGGIDAGTLTNESLTLPGRSIFNASGYRADGLTGTDLYTVDVGASATRPLVARWTSVTSAGVQYNDQRSHGNEVSVTNLAIGSPTANGGVLSGLIETGYRATTAGTYVNETVNLAERLFVTGALRVDAGSGFGKDYKAAAYPKVSASWLVSQEPGNILRLRVAYGESGVQPLAGSALRLYGPSQTQLNGASVSADTLIAYGNKDLKPERTAEIEGGIDMELFGSRLTAELTGYTKTSHDALVNVPLEGSLGGGTRQENLGSVRNRGLEGSVTGRVIASAPLDWTVTVSGSVNQNRLLRLGAGVAPIVSTLFFPYPVEQRPGYPVYGLWAYPLSYRDANHDGEIEANEVSIGATPVYVGQSMPPRELAGNSSLSLFRGSLHIGAQVDYRGDWYLPNIAAFYRANRFFGLNSSAANDPHAPLDQQARAVALATDPQFRINSGFVEPADFVRFRELSVTYAIPVAAAHAFHVSHGSIGLAIRNLALWTRYSGPDPEVNTTLGNNRVTVGAVPTTALNRDLTTDFGTLPQPRMWILSVRFGL